MILRRAQRTCIFAFAICVWGGCAPSTRAEVPSVAVAAEASKPPAGARGIGKPPTGARGIGKPPTGPEIGALGEPGESDTPHETQETQETEKRSEIVGRPNDGDEDDAELVVGRDVLGKCPTLRLVRQHVAEFDPDTVWLAVLESIADCMGQGGPMAQQSILIAGGDPQRHVVGDVFVSRGIPSSRVVHSGASVGGATLCQRGSDCSRRVDIRLVSP